MNATYFAPAKINLWLRVFAPDETGYHPLDTLFCALELCDVLSVAPAERFSLDVVGADVGLVEQNLVWRAVQQYCAMLEMPEPRLAFTLYKNIPAGAGLGGGSSDAAAALRALQAWQHDALPQPDLLELAARLGSDVPFFLCGSAFALASGRGELLEPIAALPPKAVLVVQPDFAIATRDAYQWLDDASACEAYAPPLLRPQNWDDVTRNAHNTFEAVVFERSTQLAQVRDRLKAAGARIALLSGSGSALFGVFDDEAAASAARHDIRLPAGWRTHLTRTRTD